MLIVKAKGHGKEQMAIRGISKVIPLANWERVPVISETS